MAARARARAAALLRRRLVHGRGASRRRSPSSATPTARRPPSGRRTSPAGAPRLALGEPDVARARRRRAGCSSCRPRTRSGWPPARRSAALPALRPRLLPRHRPARRAAAGARSRVGARACSARRARRPTELDAAGRGRPTRRTRPSTAAVAARVGRGRKHETIPWQQPEPRRSAAGAGSRPRAARRRHQAQPPVPPRAEPAPPPRLPARERRRPGRARPRRASASRSTPRSRSARSTTATRRSSGASSGTPRATGCPFVALVTVLVFWQAGLYAERERRAGFGRIVSSLVVVALLVLAFGLGTGPRVHHLRADPDRARDRDRARRPASARATTRSAARRCTSLGVRRRAIVVGEGEHLDHLLRTLGSARGGIDYEFVGVVSGDGRTTRDLPRARRSSTTCARCSTSTRPTS